MEPVCGPLKVRAGSLGRASASVSHPSLNELVQFLQKAMRSLFGKHPLYDAITEGEGMREGRDDVDADGEEQTPSGCLMPAAVQAAGGRSGSGQHRQDHSGKQR